MIKMMICAPRRDGMSHPEFRRYVSEVHGPLVLSVTEVAADIHHYHYNFPVSGAVDTVFDHPLATHLDIITEAWFDSVAAQLRNMEHPRYMQVLRPDEHRFANGAAAVVHYAREVAVIDGPREHFKVFYLRRRASGLSRQAFQEQWLGRFAAALRSNPSLSGAISGYVQNHVVDEAEHPDGAHPKYFDVIDEFFVSDLQAFASLQTHRPSLTAIRELETELTDTARTRAFIAETVPNIP